jgi:DNA-directed RNA polymerase subunit L
LKINVTKEEGDYIEMEFSGEGHTLLNLIQSNLLEDQNVEMAGYSKPHPLMDRAKLFVKLRQGEAHLDVVKRAASRADGKLDEFLKEFDRSLREFQA